MSQPFTPEALKRWNTIPAAVRQKLLGRVWCPHCADMTTLVDYQGRIEKGDLILTGACVRCGGSVARVIESE